MSSPEERIPLIAPNSGDSTADACNKSVKSTRSVRSVSSTPSLGPQSQKEVDSISDSPLYPFKPKEFFYIVYILLKSGLPSSFAFVAALFRGLLCLAFIGRNATSKELAGASLATSLAHMLLITLVLTINCGFLIKTSQLNGAGKADEVKSLFQRHFCLMLSVAAPIILILSFSSYVLNWINVDPEISQATVEYFRLTIVSWASMCLVDFMKSYLMAHNIYAIIGLSQLFTLAIHLGLCFYFVSGLEMPFIGPAISKSITDFGLATVLFIYIMRDPNLRKPIVSWSRECLLGWWSHLKQMVVLGCDVLVDTIILEFSLLVVLYINNEYVISAHSIAMVLAGLLFLIPLGNSIAMQTRMGNAVGENLKNKAKKLMVAGLFLNVIVCFTLCLITSIWNEQIINQMTNIPATNEILRKFLHIYSFVFIGDSFKDHFCGILKTIGREKDVLKTYLMCNIPIGTAAQWIMALWIGFGYVGIWLAVGISMFLTCTVLITKLFIVDWDKEIEIVQERIRMMRMGVKEDI